MTRPPARQARRSVLWACAAVVALAACTRSDQAAQTDTLSFSILSAQEQQSMGEYWQPVLDDLAKATGLTVKPFFATNYSALVEAMRFNQVQAGWFSALPALEAVRRADGQVVAAAATTSGAASYQSLLIVNKERGLTLDKILACDKTLSIGMGDPKSTSGTLAPMAMLFTPRGIDPATCFKIVRSANHQANFYSVSNGLLDVATNNSIGLLFYRRENPGMADKVQTIWTSPDLPESAIVVRRDLDPAVARKLTDFFTSYGKAPGPEGERQRKNLAQLEYSAFLPADNSYLQPIQLMEAGEELREARRSGDQARIAAAQKAYQALRPPAGTPAP